MFGTRTTALRAAALLMLCGLVACGYSGDEGTTPPLTAATSVCEALTPTVLGAPCDSEAWGSIAARRTSQAAVADVAINPSVGGDPVKAARRQAAEGFQAHGRGDLAPWPLVLPLDWDADPYQDRNWRFQVHAWRMLDPLLLAWQQDGDTAWIDDALRIVEDWHSYHVVQQRDSVFAWYDMATGIRAQKLAWLVDRALRGDFAVTPAQQVLLLAQADLHVQRLLDPDFLSAGNHGLFQLHGLVALCTTLPELRHCPGALDYAKSSLLDLLSRQFSPEGVHLEHSPAYHLWVADTVRRQLSSGWYTDFTDVQALMTLADANRVWMFHPDGKRVAVGDSGPGGRAPPWPAGQAACATAATEDVTACQTLKVFRQTGYAIVRSDWAVPRERASMLFFMASYHTSAHKHSDDLSFELFEAGERVLTDTGRYGYNRDPWRDFAVSTRAHNVLQIDGQDTPRDGQGAYGSALRRTVQSGASFELEGQIATLPRGQVWTRRLMYTPGRSLLVLDEVTGAPAETVTQWFHFAPQVSVRPPDTEASSVFVATLGSGRTIELQQLRGSCQGSLVRGQQSPAQGWTTVAYGKLVPRTTLGFACDGDVRVVATLFVLDTTVAAQVREEAEARLQALGL